MDNQDINLMYSIELIYNGEEKLANIPNKLFASFIFNNIDIIGIENLDLMDLYKYYGIALFSTIELNHETEFILSANENHSCTIYIHYVLNGTMHKATLEEFINMMSMLLNIDKNSSTGAVYSIDLFNNVRDFNISITPKSETPVKIYLTLFRDKE